MAASDFPQSPVRMSIVSVPAHLPVVRSAVERLCELMGFAEQDRGGIVLSVDEALTNVIKHAYHGDDDKPIEIVLRPTESAGQAALSIEVRDWGDVAEPAQIKSRDLEDVRPGGLGVHIMSSCMDEVTYTPAPDAGTVLTMLKKLTQRNM